MGQKSETKKMQEYLHKNGFKFVRQNGSHKIYKDFAGNEIVVNLKLNKMVAQRLVKEVAKIKAMA